MPCGSVLGKLYGMAKVHKDGCPLQPVNSIIGTAEYQIAKWLDQIIKPYLSDQFSVNLTKGFIDKIRNIQLKSNSICVSFDFLSLFTNVPLAEVISKIADTLFVGSTSPFPQPTNNKDKVLTKSIFIKLMKICTAGIFLYNDTIYQQVNGVAMGSPLGPVLSNWVLGVIEFKLFLNVSDFYPDLYVRYVASQYLSR